MRSSSSSPSSSSAPSTSSLGPIVVIVRSPLESISVTARRVGCERTAARTLTPSCCRRATDVRARSSSPSAVRSVLCAPRRASATATTAPPPAGSSNCGPACAISPASGTRSTRTNCTHSTCPTTATLGVLERTRASLAYDAPVPVLLTDAPDRHVRVLTLNRPEQLNAMTAELCEALHEELHASERDRACRAVVITGAGRGFCAGLDLHGYGAAPAND